MAICRDCAFNALGWCHTYHDHIPHDKIDTEHDCGHYVVYDIDAIGVIRAKRDLYPNDATVLLTIEDMLLGNTPPAGWVAAAWRHIWTASYISDIERVAIARSIIPF